MAAAFTSRAFLACAAAAGAGTLYFSTKTDAVAMAEKNTPKLYYFDITARAFPIRAALRHAKVPFEDVRVTFPELVQMRGTTGANDKVPMGQLPVIELPSGMTICQSASILRWAAKQSDLYPKDIEQALLVDEIVETATEMRSKVPDSKDETEKKKLRAEFVERTLPTFMDYFTRRINSHGGPFILGKQYSMADLFLARVIDGFVNKKIDYITKENLEKWPVVLQHYARASAHDVIKNETQHEEEFQKSKKH